MTGIWRSLSTIYRQVLERRTLQFITRSTEADWRVQSHNMEDEPTEIARRTFRIPLMYNFGLRTSSVVVQVNTYRPTWHCTRPQGLKSKAVEWTQEVRYDYATSTRSNDRVSCNCITNSVRTTQGWGLKLLEKKRFWGKFSGFRGFSKLLKSAVMPQCVVCPSVCLSVTFRYRDQIGWNTLK